MPITVQNNENLKNAAAHMVDEHIFNNCKLTNWGKYIV
jgi:hypothetical protein